MFKSVFKECLYKVASETQSQDLSPIYEEIPGGSRLASIFNLRTFSSTSTGRVCRAVAGLDEVWQGRDQLLSVLVNFVDLQHYPTLQPTRQILLCNVRLQPRGWRSHPAQGGSGSGGQGCSGDLLR